MEQFLPRQKLPECTALLAADFGHFQTWKDQSSVGSDPQEQRRETGLDWKRWGWKMQVSRARWLRRVVVTA